MALVRWLIVLMALTESGWMALDGGRALLAGDSVTPRTVRQGG